MSRTSNRVTCDHDSLCRHVLSPRKYGLLQWEFPILSIRQDGLEVTASHEFGDHEWLTLVITQVEHRDDVRMRVESSHRLGFTGDMSSGYGVQLVGLDQREGDISVHEGVLSELDHLLSALTKEPLHLISAIGERGWLLRAWVLN